MKVIAIWKVPAINTRDFIDEMRKKGIRNDGDVSNLSVLSGFNFWYESTESFGNVSEFAARHIVRNHGVGVKEFSIVKPKSFEL